MPQLILHYALYRILCGKSGCTLMCANRRSHFYMNAYANVSHGTPGCGKAHGTIHMQYDASRDTRENE